MSMKCDAALRSSKPFLRSNWASTRVQTVIQPPSPVPPVPQRLGVLWDAMAGQNLPEKEIRRLLSKLRIDHEQATSSKELDQLLTRAIKKVECLSEAVAGGAIAGQKKIDPSALER